MKVSRRRLSRGRGLTKQEREICDEIRRHAGKYIAIARDWSRIVAVGKSRKETYEKAIAAGFPDAPVFLAARDYNWIGH